MRHDVSSPTPESDDVPTPADRVQRQTLGYGVDYLKQARIFGRGPSYIRVGRSIRYRIRDLDQWLEAHRVVPRGQRGV